MATRLVAPCGRGDHDAPMDDPVADWLRRFLDRHGGSSGTVHVIDGDALHLTAAVKSPRCRT